MAIGIDPTNDYAFKRVFGDNEHSSITVHFLNSVLDPSPRIASVDIRSPILDQEGEDDKLAMLDILPRDESGRQFNIEMQTTFPVGLTQRLAYYASSLYIDQSTEGMDYADLRPAVSICVLRKSLFPHIVREADPIERWAYFLNNVEWLELGDVERLFSDPEFLEAAEVLHMIARTPEEKQRYLFHRKAEMDAAAKLRYALREGVQIGEIRLMQKLLGGQPTSLDELSDLSLDQQAQLVAELETQLRERGMLPQ